MQTNTPWGYNDLDIITRLYRKQNKLQKSYKIIYQSKDGKKDFIGAAKDIIKARVYIKTPQEAPQGTKVGHGERGGLYYETREQQHFTQEVSTIEQNVRSNMKFTPQEESAAENLINIYTPIAKNEFKRVLTTIGGNISHRIKNKYSILEKAKRKNIQINQVRDIFGMRIEVNTINDVYDTVKKLELIYGDKIIKKEDAIQNPHGLYRSYHIDVQHANGIYSEIQIRTPLMDKISNASHILLYKNNQQMDERIKTNIQQVLETYSNIAVNRARIEDIRALPETKKILEEFGLL